MFSPVANHGEAVAVTGLMPCAMPAASVGGSARAAWNAPNSRLGLRRGPNHQNGEPVTRMVITNLVRPWERPKQQENSLKTQFSGGETSRRSPPPPIGSFVAPPHIPAVRSRSELVPLGPPGGASFVRFCRSSTNPNPRAVRERSFVPA